MAMSEKGIFWRIFMAAGGAPIRLVFHSLAAHRRQLLKTLNGAVMKNIHRALLSVVFTALAASPSAADPIVFPCGLASSDWDDVALTVLPLDLNLTQIQRREFVEISEGLAAALGIGAADLHGDNQPNPQIRLRTQSSPANSGIENNNSVFTVRGIRPGSGNRVYVHRRLNGTDRHAGQFKILATTGTSTFPATDANLDGRVDDVILKAYPVPVSKSFFTSSAGVTTTTFNCEPSGSKSYVEIAIRRDDDRVVAIAPHGGNIETSTSAQAMRFASTLESLDSTPVNVWNLEGKWGDNQTFVRWHITAPNYDIASYPGLVQLLPADGTFDRAVAFHGFGGTEGAQACPGQADRPLFQVILGGGAPRNLKCAVARSINAAATAAERDGEIGIALRDNGGNIDIEDNCGRAVNPPAGLDGLAAANIVNRLASLGGIQLEQSSELRGDATLAEVVADGAADGFRDFAANSLFNYCAGL